jgi:hypothetical protein
MFACGQFQLMHGNFGKALPIIFGYMIFVCCILGGKLREGKGYH